MKKIFVAFFMAFIMLMIPVTSVAQTQHIENISKLSALNDDLPKIFITAEERDELNQYIENNFNDDLKDDALGVVNSIINDDLEVDTIALAEALDHYGYHPIPQDKLTVDITESELKQLLEEYWGVVDGVFTRNLFGNLINKIIDLIRGRLGWMYQLFTDGVYLFREGVRLVIDYIQLPIVVIVAFISIINQILAIPQLLSNLVKLLFSLKFSDFINTVLDFVHEFGQDLSDMINAVKQLLNDFVSIKEYLGEIQAFIVWLAGEPWKQPILVTGAVKKNMLPLAGATIICRGQTTKTDSNGEFSFYVNSTPDDDSVPPGQWYGMHNCAITVSENGEILKESPKLLSYAFSGGEINWVFRIWKSRSSSMILHSRVEQVLQKIQLFLSGLHDSFYQKLFKLSGIQRSC